MDLTLSVFSNNISSVLRIYRDSEKIRLKNKNELLEKLEKDVKLTSSEFEQLSHYDSHFEWLLIHSLFISAYSYLENFMFSIAQQVEKNTKSEIKLNDIRGKGDLDRYRKYINKIVEIEKAKNDYENWNQISEFKAIRNSIIHKYGVMDKKINLIKKYDLYFGPSKKMIRIKNVKFLEDFCALSIEYMNEIVNEIKEKNYSS